MNGRLSEAIATYGGILLFWMRLSPLFMIFILIVIALGHFRRIFIFKSPPSFSRDPVGTRFCERMYIKEMTPKACCTSYCLFWQRGWGHWTRASDWHNFMCPSMWFRRVAFASHCWNLSLGFLVSSPKQKGQSPAATNVYRNGKMPHRGWRFAKWSWQCWSQSFSLYENWAHR